MTYTCIQWEYIWVHMHLIRVHVYLYTYWGYICTYFRYISTFGGKHIYLLGNICILTLGTCVLTGSNQDDSDHNEWEDYEDNEDSNEDTTPIPLARTAANQLLQREQTEETYFPNESLRTYIVVWHFFPNQLPKHTRKYVTGLRIHKGEDGIKMPAGNLRTV